MSNNTKKRKKRGPILCAGIVIAVLAICLMGIILPLSAEVVPDFPAVGILLFYGAVIAVMILGIVLALRQRLKEIEGGEEEDASQY